MLEYLSAVRAPASEAELASLRQLVGRVPPDYLNLLSSSNGGTLVRQLFAIAAPWGVDASVCQRLSSVAEVVDAYRLRVSDTEQRLPPRTLPIADDPGGSVLLLSCEDETFGQVFFWDHERENPQQLRTEQIADFANTVTKVAKSLEHFLTEVLRSEEGFGDYLDELREQPRPPMPAPAEERPAPDLVAPGLRDDTDDFQVYSILHDRHGGGLIEQDALVGLTLPDAFRQPAPLADGWEPLGVRFNPHAAADARYLDVPYFPYHLILRESARQVLARYLDNFGELLPLESDQGELFIFHCLTQVDALDPSCVRFDESRRRFVLRSGFLFRPEALGDHGIFTVTPADFAHMIWLTRPAAEQLVTLLDAAGLAYPNLLMHWSG